MLDFSWSEFLVIAVVAIIAIGPRQIPEVLYHFGRIVRRLQYVRFALTKQFEDFMEKSDLEEMRKISDHVQAGINEPLFMDKNNTQDTKMEAEGDILHHGIVPDTGGGVENGVFPAMKGVPPISPYQQVEASVSTHSRQEGSVSKDQKI